MINLTSGWTFSFFNIRAAILRSSILPLVQDPRKACPILRALHLLDRLDMGRRWRTGDQGFQTGDINSNGPF